MTDRNLLNAILAMDSYNREYGEGLTGLGDAVGCAKFFDHKALGAKDDEFAKWQTAGFYAAAYKLGDGSTVISYRGTDKAFSEDAIVGGDVWNGWSLALGYPAGSQADLAMSFYKSVTELADVRQLAVNTELVGHSLGGGLAGFVSVLSGTTPRS